MAPRKFATGTCFEIAFESDGFLPVGESDRRFNFPGFVFRGVRTSAFVMLQETGV